MGGGMAKVGQKAAVSRCVPVTALDTSLSRGGAHGLETVENPELGVKHYFGSASQLSDSFASGLLGS